MIKNCQSCKIEFTKKPNTKGKFCSYKCYWENLKGQRLSPHTEFKKGDTEGNKAWNWKGNKVGYHALHSWIYRKLGKPQECKFCGSIKTLEWANVSQEYKRELSDWMALCKKCHYKYDDIGTKIWRTIRLKENISI